MNNPTERDRQIARRLTEDITRHLRVQCNFYVPYDHQEVIESVILAAIQDANQQGNEDTARLSENWRRRITKYKEQGTNRYGQGYIAAMETCAIQLDAARGVQPAAKDIDITDACVTDEASSRTCERGTKACIIEHGSTAQQESAPAAEQAIDAIEDGLRDALIAIQDVCIQVPLPPLYAILRKFGRRVAAAAPSPAQDEPVAASVEQRAIYLGLECLEGIKTDMMCHGQKMKWQSSGRASEKRFDEARAALRDALAASSPSEQKSSLPSETRTPQERENEESGNY